MRNFTLCNKWVSVYDLFDDFEVISKGRGDNKIEYLNVPCVFDIEASSFYVGDEKQAVMYAWVFGINGSCIRGRTWKEFVDVLDMFIKHYNLNERKRLICYVHNLSYEFQFMRRIFKWVNVFSLDERKPIYAVTSDGIEFRCSYLLSGYSLEKVGENLKYYPVKKLKGDLDYDLLRLCNTPLTDTEWGYILNDGLVVMAYIQEEIDRLGDILDLPITKTGYVRMFCREKCLRVNTFYQRIIADLKLEPDEYVRLKEGFMGGYTHGNHNWIGKNIFVGKTVNKVKINSIGSYDLTSSYPTVMVSERFPMGKGQRVKVETQDRFYTLIKYYCCLMTVRLHNVEPKFDYEHYIASAKCLHYENAVQDNGRIVSADDILLTITEIDWEIISKTYSFEYFQVIDMWVYQKEYLPKSKEAQPKLK